MADEQNNNQQNQQNQQKGKQNEFKIRLEEIERARPYLDPVYYMSRKEYLEEVIEIEKEKQKQQQQKVSRIVNIYIPKSRQYLVTEEG
jgi:hypothetical protein